jgi:APA family basic amino acid/polyamine antiporter
MAGSAYTYGYATLGEFFAWIIGWDLILEYAVGAITVGIGCSGYVVSFLNGIGIHIPPEISAAPGTRLVSIPPELAASLQLSAGWQVLTEAWARHLTFLGIDLAALQQATAVFNLPAVIVIFIVTTLLIVGVKESSNFNSAIVFVKLAVLLLFIVGAAGAVKSVNWQPFIPPNIGAAGHFGWTGVMTGAGIIFFAYIGFDAVSTAAQESKNPQRDMPIGIIGSLLICTVVYIVVSAIATGVVPYQQLDVPNPIALAASRAGMPKMMLRTIELGAIGGCFSVILVMLFGQSRVFWAMSKDGLLPPFVNRVHPRFRTPWITSIVTGIAVAFFAAVFTVREAGSLCSIGTLLAFVIVSVGVLVLRLREPNLPRAFKTPWVWLVAPMGVISALYLMISLPWRTWERLLIWLLIGQVIYFSYAIRKSKLAHKVTPTGSR